MPEDSPKVGIEVSIAKGHVLVQFPQLLRWIAFSPEDARKFAEVLLDKARQASAVRNILQEREILRS